MFIALFLAAASAAGTDAILIVNDQPTVRIDLVGYDLRSAHDVQRVEAGIHRAANRVCRRGYGVANYLERVACVKSAIADADRQLGDIASRPPTTLAAASISISTK